MSLVLFLILAFAARVEVYTTPRTEIVCGADDRGRRVEYPRTFLTRAVRLRPASTTNERK